MSTLAVVWGDSMEAFRVNSGENERELNLESGVIGFLSKSYEPNDRG